MALSKVIIRGGTRCEGANYPTASEPGTQLVFTTHIVEELKPCYLFAFSMEKKKIESKAVTAGFWKRCHSEIAFLGFETYRGPSFREIKHAHTYQYT